MSEPTDNLRGLIRRYAFIHTTMWVLLVIVVSVMFAGHADWSRAWVLLIAFAPTFIMVPPFAKFHRLARRAGYSNKRALTMYLLGTSKRDVERIIEAVRTRREAWSALLQKVREEEPELLQKIEDLHQRDNLDGAAAVFERAKANRRQLAQRREAEIARLQAESAKLYCDRIVDALVARGDLGQAAQVVTTCRSLLDRARQFSVHDEVAAALGNMVGDADFSAAERLLKEAANRREMNRLKAELTARISEAPPHEHDGLYRLVDELAQLAFGSRDFRKKYHELEAALGQAFGNA